MDPTAPIPEGPQYGRTIYTVVSLLCTALLSTLFGLRLKSFGLTSWSALRGITPIRFIVAAIYLSGLALMLSLGLMLSGVDLENMLKCRLGIYLCLLWYVCANKVLMYLFLVERAHVVRAATHSRRRDAFWWAGVFIIVCGFGTLALIALISPPWIRSGPEGCMMGLPPRLEIPLLVYDFCINILLTLLFVSFLLRMLRFRGGFRIDQCWICRVAHKILGFGSCPAGQRQPLPVMQGAKDNPYTKKLESLIKRSLIGSALNLIPTIINLSILFAFDGWEQGWACFTGCSLDVTWSIVVIHWLTGSDPATNGNSCPPNSAVTSAVTSQVRPEVVRVDTCMTCLLQEEQQFAKADNKQSPI